LDDATAVVGVVDLANRGLDKLSVDCLDNVRGHSHSRERLLALTRAIREELLVKLLLLHILLWGIETLVV
jgi:hypothetical protein